MTRGKGFQGAAAVVEQVAGVAQRLDEPVLLGGEGEGIPQVCFIEDICRVLRMSRRSVERQLSHGTFPIRQLPALDRRPRWSGAAVRRFLSGAR